MNNLELEKLANEIRKSIVTAVHSAKSGHPGGSLSSADIFTYLYFEEMNIDPKNPKMEGRDRFVLSKGHVAPAYYSTLAERGFFPKEDLVTLRHTGSYLQGHPDMKHIPGVDMSSGSLGQGVSAAVGMAAAGKFDHKDYRVYTLTGDGEIRTYDRGEILQFAGDNRFDEAFCFDEKSPDMLGVAAISDGKIIGMAGASADSPLFWQIGINVEKEAECRHIASTLVTILKEEIEKLGKVPYYGTSMSNLASQRAAVNAGFRVAWVELLAEAKI